MHVHRIGPDFSADRFDVVARRRTELTTVAGLVILGPVDVQIALPGLGIVDPESGVEDVQRVTAILNKVIRREERAAGW
ncbi:hypothetical protein D9M68_314400 [compost metagenome]